MDRVSRTDPGYRERLLAGALSCLSEKGYARTTARDLVAASGTNLASIGYHFGGKDALLSEAIVLCYEAWTERVEHALFSSVPGTPREMLERAMSALVDVFEEMRPTLIGCVEGYAPALREQVLREKLAGAYAKGRKAGVEMIERISTELGVEPPAAPEAVVSVLIAISDGLLLQWLLDPASTPDARQVVDALAALSAFIG